MTALRTLASRKDGPPTSCPGLDCHPDPDDLYPELREAHLLALENDPKWSEVELTEPIVLRNLLSDEQIEDILTQTSAAGVWPRGVAKSSKADSPSPSRELESVAHHFAWENEHVVLYMHNDDHWFVRTLPIPWSRIRGGMESRPWMGGAIPELAEEFIGSDESMVDVRCIELHHYSVGGGLFTAGHRDFGSELTISVLLSDPDEVTGGDFVTYPQGVPFAHKIGKGDAILFNSHKLHNISTVTGGVRKSLVVELWPSKRY